MLPFLPTPYPDELWYSVLCRYQIRCGNTNLLLTRSNEEPFFLFPNRSIYETVQMLPEGVFDVQTLILNHTLFPYFCRIKTLDEKMKMLEALSNGQAISSGWKSNAKTSQVLRYCPLCKQDELTQYGETYWHREHQIPFMTVCPKHHCRLVPYERVTSWKLDIVMPGHIEDGILPDFGTAPYEARLAEMMYHYLTAPLELSPTKGYSNLDLELEKRYRKIRGSRIGMIDTELLYTDLVELFGEHITRGSFGRRITHNLSMKLRSWNFPAPERYILLATLIDQLPEVTFGRTLAAASFEKRVCGMAESRTKHTRQRTA